MWNDGLLRLAATHGLDLVQTARMLAMAHVAGGDAMIACFDAKYHYWFWRPYQAIPGADSDGDRRTVSLNLSEAGAQAVSRWHRVNEDIIRAALAGLPHRDRAALRDAAPALRDLTTSIDAQAD